MRETFFSFFSECLFFFDFYSHHVTGVIPRYGADFAEPPGVHRRGAEAKYHPEKSQEVLKAGAEGRAEGSK